MHQQDCLSLEAVLELIEQASRLSTLDAVGFTGGDPFLHVGTVRAGIELATRKGLKTRVVTSGYWAGTAAKATDALRPLVEAGLQELCISYDDSHVKFVKEQSLINAYDAAEYFGIKTTIYMSTDVGDRIDAEYVRRMLGVAGEDNPRLLIIESQVTSTGRATQSASADKKRLRLYRPKTHLGACPSMLRQPAVTPTGKILPCCGTIPFRDGLCIGDIAQDRVDDAMRRAFDDDLYKWIAFEGPASVLVQITAATDEPLAQDDFDGICHACDVLFSSARYQALARAYLDRKASSLRVTETVLAAAGMYQSPDVES